MSQRMFTRIASFENLHSELAHCKQSGPNFPNVRVTIQTYAFADSIPIPSILEWRQTRTATIGGALCCGGRFVCVTIGLSAAACGFGDSFTGSIWYDGESAMVVLEEESGVLQVGEYYMLRAVVLMAKREVRRSRQ